jgi:hypothetical protein
VATFVGPNEKDLNHDLIAMSAYCGFRPNVTNCYSGNEKGHVESGVKNVRKEVFAVRYRFASIEEAEGYLERELACMNGGSRIIEERKHLMPYRAPLELSRLTTQRVDKYSFVRVENNFYSVPEHLVGREVTARCYVKEIVVYSGLSEVCRHKRKDGFGEMSVNIFHYLDTLTKKPGALRNSKALRSEVELKAVFDSYFTTCPREFIDLLRANQDKPMDEIVRIIKLAGEGCEPVNVEKIESSISKYTQIQLVQISDFFMRGRVGNGH